jgi:hypothetical protein
MNRSIVWLRSRVDYSAGFDDVSQSRLSSSLRPNSEFNVIRRISFTMLLIPLLLERLEITKIQRQGNELSRESRSCTSWPHLQRISSYSPAMRGSRYARRTSYRKCFLPIWRCTSRARSSEEELSDTFHRYGTVCHYASISSRPSLAE